MLLGIVKSEFIFLNISLDFKGICFFYKVDKIIYI